MRITERKNDGQHQQTLGPGTFRRKSETKGQSVKRPNNKKHGTHGTKSEKSRIGRKNDRKLRKNHETPLGRVLFPVSRMFGFLPAKDKPVLSGMKVIDLSFYSSHSGARFVLRVPPCAHFEVTLWLRVYPFVVFRSFAIWVLMCGSSNHTPNMYTTKYVHSNIFRKNAICAQQKLITKTGAHIPLSLCSTRRFRFLFHCPCDFPFGSP